LLESRFVRPIWLIATLLGVCLAYVEVPPTYAKKGANQSRSRSVKRGSKAKSKRGKTSSAKARKTRKGRKGRKVIKRSTKRTRKRKPKLKRQRYTVTRGETWGSISKRLGSSIKSLKRWNRRVSRRKLKAGQRIIFYGKVQKTESVGRPNRGSLKHGVHLDPDGDGLGRGFAVSPHRPDLWGTPELVRSVKQCGRTYRRYFARKYAPIAIGDLSSRDGGPLKKHKSHQSGRDVDVGFMRRKPLAKGYFKDTSPREMNMYAQWVVLKCFLDDPLIDKVFIERSRVRALKKYIKRIYKTRKEKLKRYLSYFPGGKRKAIYPDKVHKSHMHVRIKCPKGDRRCAG